MFRKIALAGAALAVLAAPALAQDGLLSAAGRLAKKKVAPATAPAAPAGAAPSDTVVQRGGGKQQGTSIMGGGEFSSGPNIAGAEVVVTKKPVASLAEAKAAAISEVADGDDVYIYLKGPQPLSTYSEVVKQAGQPVMYKLLVEVTPKGDKRAFDTCMWYLTPAEAAKSEIALGLSPVSARGLDADGYLQTTKMLCWLRAVGSDGKDAGRWENQILWASAVQGQIGNTIASAPLTANLPNGFPKYNKAFKSADRCNPRDRDPGKPFYCPR